MIKGPSGSPSGGVSAPGSSRSALPPPRLGKAVNTGEEETDVSGKPIGQICFGGKMLEIQNWGLKGKAKTTLFKSNVWTWLFF